MRVGLILLLCRGGVLEAGEGFFDVPRHGEVDFPFLVVPLDGESAVLFAFPVAQAFVIFLHCVYQMLCILIAHIFYPEIIDNKREADQVGIVFP